MADTAPSNRDKEVPVLNLSDLPPPPKGKKGWPWTESPPPLDPPSGESSWPPLGVVTPSFAQGRYLEATLRSVLLQGYPALEFYVEDGGSTDESVEIIRKYEKFLSGWVSEKDRGQSHAINKGMARLRRAQWVNWLNSDDILLPGALEAIGRWAQGKPEAVAVVGRGVLVFERGGSPLWRGPRDDLDGTTVRQWRTYGFYQSACFFSKSAFDQVGGLTEALFYAMDVELWVKLGEIGTFDKLKDPLAQILVHDQAKTSLAGGKAVAESCEILFQRGYPEDARLLISQISDELSYMDKLLSPVTRNFFYRKLIRPVLRRFFAPPHLRE